MGRRLLAAIVAGALVLPLALLLLLSLARHWPWPQLLPEQWQVRLWREVLADSGGIGAAALRSAGMALGVASTATALAFAASPHVATHRRRASLLALLHLPYAVSPAVVGVGLLYGFLRLGLAGHMLGVMLAQLIFAYAYAAILLTGFWNRRIFALAELARTLGAGSRQVWTRVLVPAAAPLLAVCLFQTFLISWFDYPLASFIGGGQVQTLPIRLFEYLGAGDVHLSAVCALLLMLPPLLCLLFMRQVVPGPVAPFSERGDD